MIKDKRKSWSLVGLQFGLLGLLIAQSHVQFNVWATLYALSGAIGLWAVWAMGIGNFNVVPDVKPNAIFIFDKPPYKWIRHPMYTSFLLFCLGLVLQPFELIKLFEWFILAFVLNYKATYEESLLNQVFENYQDYAQETKRFLPFIY
jgi:protein-S-isoprenylcysteine O-methyltransferase Ste14